MKPRKYQEVALGDNNCAFNAFLLGLCEQDVLNNIEANIGLANIDKPKAQGGLREFITDIGTALGLSGDDLKWVNIKDRLIQLKKEGKDGVKLQQKLQQPLREFSAKQARLDNTYADRTWNSVSNGFTDYVRKELKATSPTASFTDAGMPDDVFLPQFKDTKFQEILEKYAEIESKKLPTHITKVTPATPPRTLFKVKDRGDANIALNQIINSPGAQAELEGWWKNATRTEKSGCGQFIDKMAKDKQLAGDLELGLLAKYLGVNFEVENILREATTSAIIGTPSVNISHNAHDLLPLDAKQFASVYNNGNRTDDQDKEVKKSIDRLMALKIIEDLNSTQLTTDLRGHHAALNPGVLGRVMGVLSAIPTLAPRLQFRANLDKPTLDARLSAVSSDAAHITTIQNCIATQSNAVDPTTGRRVPIVDQPVPPEMQALPEACKKELIARNIIKPVDASTPIASVTLIWKEDYRDLPVGSSADDIAFRIAKRDAAVDSVTEHPLKRHVIDQYDAVYKQVPTISLRHTGRKDSNFGHWDNLSTKSPASSLVEGPLHVNDFSDSTNKVLVLAGTHTIADHYSEINFVRAKIEKITGITVAETDPNILAKKLEKNLQDRLQDKSKPLTKEEIASLSALYTFYLQTIPTLLGRDPETTAENIAPAFQKLRGQDSLMGMLLGFFHENNHAYFTAYGDAHTVDISGSTEEEKQNKLSTFLDNFFQGNDPAATATGGLTLSNRASSARPKHFTATSMPTKDEARCTTLKMRLNTEVKAPIAIVDTRKVDSNGKTTLMSQSFVGGKGSTPEEKTAAGNNNSELLSKNKDACRTLAIKQIESYRPLLAAEQKEVNPVIWISGTNYELLAEAVKYCLAKGYNHTVDPACEFKAKLIDLKIDMTEKAWIGKSTMEKYQLELVDKGAAPTLASEQITEADKLKKLARELKVEAAKNTAEISRNANIVRETPGIVVVASGVAAATDNTRLYAEFAQVAQQELNTSADNAIKAAENAKIFAEKAKRSLDTQRRSDLIRAAKEEMDKGVQALKNTQAAVTTSNIAAEQSARIVKQVNPHTRSATPPTLAKAPAMPEDKRGIWDKIKRVKPVTSRQILDSKAPREAKTLMENAKVGTASTSTTATKQSEVDQLAAELKEIKSQFRPGA